MASSSKSLSIVAIIFLLNLTQVIGAENIVLEEGYTVTTIIDGNKLNFFPYAAFSQYGPSPSLIVLDHVKSAVYTVSFSDSQVNGIKKLSGNAKGIAGYKDGDLGSAEFNKPKSFALDKKNNIYIADQSNHVIRKISNSGVTTIAGGNTRKMGKVDGPAQNASFSDNFELVFDSQRCAILISDHGNSLIRQLNLKAEDCADTSSGSVLGSTVTWGIGVVVACLVGFVIGFVFRPYVLPTEASGQHLVNMTWKHFLTNLGKQAVTFYSVTKNATANARFNNLYQLLKKFLTLSFSQLPLLFGINIISPPTTPRITPVSLLDCDDLGVNNEAIETTHDLVDELKDLITLNGTQNLELCLENQENGCDIDGVKEGVGNGGKIDEQIYANFVGFVEGSRRRTCSSVGSWNVRGS